MSQVLSELGGVAVNTAGETIAYAAGSAGRTTLSPVAEAIAQVAWSEAPIRLPPAEFLALGVSQGQVDPDQAATWAKKQGIGLEQWQAMVDVTNTGPALGYAYAAWRRGDLTDAEFDTALKRTGLEDQWNAAMRSLKDERLDLGALATAIHRGIIAGAGLLLAEPPQTPGHVPFVQPSNIDPLSEAAAHGIDQERLRILVGNTGLPLSLGEMLQLKNRGRVTDDDVRRSIAESNVRNEYMDVALDLARRLLTPREYAEADLRGVLTHVAAAAGAGLSGLTSADYETLFETVGRPLNVHAITTGLARGATLGGTYDDVDEPYRDAIRRSNIRPEYAKLAWANRYTYPSAFVLRSLVQGGEITADDGHTLLLQIGWPPDLATKVAEAWGAGTGSTGTSYTKKAETQLWNATHKSYVNSLTTDPEAQADLAALGVPSDEIQGVLKLWGQEREIIRRSLTPAQIVKAVGEPGKDTAWATERLGQLGYSPDDITTLLAE